MFSECLKKVLGVNMTLHLLVTNQYPTARKHYLLLCPLKGYDTESMFSLGVVQDSLKGP